MIKASFRALATTACLSCVSAYAGTIIQDATVFDGTGAAGVITSVKIDGSRIVQVGDVQSQAGDKLVDARGLVLAPGFIDTHSHHEFGIDDSPAAIEAVSQGITTIVVGQDGSSPDELPLARYFAHRQSHPVSVNIASYAGHNTLREKVMGLANRKATAGEIRKMQDLLRADMEAGALGLSTGLEYDPGIYSSTDEVLALAHVAAAAGGRYISHLRSEDRYFWQALEELVSIGEQAGLPVQISHIKLGALSLWGQAGKVLARLDAARKAGIDVSADIYPYTYWQSTLTVLFPERNFEDIGAAEYALTELSTADGMHITQFDAMPEFVGKTIADVAAMRNEAPAATYLWLLKIAKQHDPAFNGQQVVGVSMSDADVKDFMSWPHTNFCSDGALKDGHPRGAGSFPRIFGHYVREENSLDLATAIHKATGLAAEHTGIAERGYIRPGFYADLVLFNPASITDRATIEEPGLPSVGIDTVWVNGKVVFQNERASGALPGTVIRR
ncbi:D-aminoacylase [Microbulbifer magnicolonia]|uniref:N-acyl-D-amino-acid deacylase family protein n=1 Tax=Microbulbifer magnicolonia TaxID=3109744 RepID=UPI002B406492|nr:D-aminoacylase [Microbulbifer sp. GG15]